MDSKLQFRTNCKNIRKTLDMTKKSRELVSKIRELKEYITARNVMIYYPLKYEVDLLELLKDDKNFYLPKVKDDELLVCPYSNKFELSEYNIQEPCTNPVEPDILDLVIVPALAVDKNNYRLGYGKGFYDRFLGQYPNIKSITAIPDELVFDSLPVESFDKRINIIVSV